VALARSERTAARGRPALVFAVNPEKVMKAQRDSALRELLRRGDVLLPDGIGVCLASLILDGRMLTRIPGADLMLQICERAAAAGLSVFVYGGEPEVNEQACTVLLRRFPALRIAGRAHGFGPETGPDSVTAQIRAVRPDIVFVALGSPRQEQWMAGPGAQLPVGLMQGVGGTLDVLAGKTRRAPAAMRQIGLEWLYRLLAQPSRWRRQVALLSFIRYVVGMRRELRRREARR
ncbi:MAG TPA: WecB/TagA/CpsF family glycosyltransferase, partial [Burkholderiaceae bacterium]|nr:WecB/TagA/CpsF family glycosyltransferase [Burkholderiaceae bacterium]